MRVMCITDRWRKAPDCLDAPHPSYGKACTVIKQEQRGIQTAYWLAEYCPDEFWYDAKNFVPLSDIDETEIIKERINEPLHA